MSGKLPHAGVYVRLGVSHIEGVGVFAIRPIPQGTNIFANDKVEIVWIERDELERSNPLPAERAFYDAFAIQRGSRLGCPVNFHNLTPGWYCNEPRDGDRANVDVDDSFNFRAARDIAEGEELTIRYAEFSDARG